MSKSIEITLTWGLHQYKVSAISNTTELKPGQWLDVDYVKKLCELPGWEVKIIDDQLIQQLLGAAIGVGISKV